MDQAYRDATTRMESLRVHSDYVIGWQGGYLGHPMREEQRLTEAYSAGFADGGAQNTDHFSAWIKAAED